MTRSLQRLTAIGNGASAIQIMFASTFFYAMIPVAAVRLGAPQSLAFAVSIKIATLAIVGLVYVRSLRWEHLDHVRRHIVLLLSENVAFFLAMYFLFWALERGPQVSVVLIAEMWPLIVALLLPFAFGETRRIRRIVTADAPFVLLSIVGFVILSAGDVRLNGIDLERGSALLALASAICMSVSVTLKARATNIFVNRYGLSPGYGFALLNVPSLLLLPIVFLDRSPALTGSLDALALIALLNVVSSLIFAVGTLRTRKSTDTLVWFVAPLVTTLVGQFFGFARPTSAEIVGAILIISSNFFLNFPADYKMSYKIGVLALIAYSLACFYYPGLNEQGYFEAISVSTIFFAILIAFLLERTSSRFDEEIRLVNEINYVVNSDQCSTEVKQAITGKLVDLMAVYDRGEIRERYHRLLADADRLSGDERNRYTMLLNSLVYSRVRGIGFGEFVALAGVTALCVVTAIVARPPRLLYEFTAVMIAFSITFTFASLLDMVAGRYGESFRRSTLPGALQVRVAPFVVPREYVGWSSFLIVMIVFAIAALFATKYGYL